MEIKEILNGVENIGILTRKNANNDALGASLALFFALKSAGKKVSFPSKEIPKEILNYVKKNGKQFQVIFEEEISEVYYEKKGKGIALYLTPKNNDASDEKFSCKVISGDDLFSSNYDLLFTIGINEFGDVEKLCDTDQLYNCTIINIDNNLNNQNYGEINVIKEDESLSQIVACLLKDIDEYTNKEADKFLLYGLAFSNKKADQKKKLSTIKWLLKNGGDFSLFSGDEQKNKLLEVVLKNLISDNNSYISTISEEDFKSTKTTSKDLGFITEKLKNFLNISSFFILWESRTSPLSVKGLFYTNKKYIVEKMMNGFKGNFKEKGGIFLTEENEMNFAINKITSYLNNGNN